VREAGAEVIEEEEEEVIRAVRILLRAEFQMSAEDRLARSGRVLFVCE